MKMDSTDQPIMMRCSRSNSRLVDLTTEVLSDLFLRLPVKSLCCLQCVCKTLKKVVDCRLFIKQRLLMTALDTNNAADHDEVPQFIVTEPIGYGYTLQVVEYDGHMLRNSKHGIVSDIVTEGRFSTGKYAKYHLHFVFYNLVLFTYSECGGPCYLFNPLKGEVLMLPESHVQVPMLPPDYRRNTMELLDWYGMGFDVAGSVKIVRVSGNVEYNKLVAQVLVLGTSLWREIRSVPPCNLNFGKKVFAYGEMHWLVCVDNCSPNPFGLETKCTISHLRICSFDFEREEFYWTPHPTFSSERFNHLEHLRLLNLRGSMAIVDTSSDKCIDIWVLKNYDDKKEWTRKYQIDTNVFPLVKQSEKLLWSCATWEHGIFFRTSNRRADNTIFFLDLTSISVNPVIYSFKHPRPYFQIYSFTGTMISLKDYGNLDEAKPESKPIEQVEESSNFFHVRRFHKV